MKKFLHIILALIVIFNGCGKNSLIITPTDEEKQQTEVVYLDETESIIDFLTPVQTGILNSEMMNSPGLVVLSYSQFIDEFGNRFDTTLAYAVFRDLNSPPINMGRWQERKGIDIGDVYLENIKFEKDFRKMRNPMGHHGRADTSYGFEYRIKIKNFDFKHSSKHKFKIVDKSGIERNFELDTPNKNEIDGSPEYDGKSLKIKFKTKTDSLSILINAPFEINGETIFKPVMILKIKNQFGSKINIDANTLNLIPPEYRKSYLVLSIVQSRKSFISIPNYQFKVSGLVTSTLYFKMDLR